MKYKQWVKMPHKDWNTEPISPTCQVCMGIPNGIIKLCDSVSTKVYPSMGGGWMSLCALHGHKHTEAFDLDEVIANGEKYEL